jgi:hypothetical protein
MKENLTPDECLDLIARLAQELPRILSEGRVLPSLSGGFLEAAGEPERMPWDPVFIGGGIVKLLITDPVAPPPSRTKDLDLVYAHETEDQWDHWHYKLRQSDFIHDPFNKDDPSFILYYQDVRVDFLPDRYSKGLGKTNRWFLHVMRDAQYVEIKGAHGWIASAPCFLATKFEAFRNPARPGSGDYLGSKDMEDIMAVVDGRLELVHELAQADRDLRIFVSRCCQDLCTDERFKDALESLVPDSGRELEVYNRLQAMAALLLG